MVMFAQLVILTDITPLNTQDTALGNIMTSDNTTFLFATTWTLSQMDTFLYNFHERAEKDNLSDYQRHVILEKAGIDSEAYDDWLES